MVTSLEISTASDCLLKDAVVPNAHPTIGLDACFWLLWREMEDGRVTKFGRRRCQNDLHFMKKRKKKKRIGRRVTRAREKGAEQGDETMILVWSFLPVARAASHKLVCLLPNLEYASSAQFGELSMSSHNPISWA